MSSNGSLERVGPDSLDPKTPAKLPAVIQEVDVENGSTDPDYSHIDPKKVLRKIDMRILPIITLLYLMNYIDRGNIGNAKIEGLVMDLHMTSQQFNICLSVFFVSYALVEIPCNMLLKKLKPAIWLPSIMVAWGVVMTLMGLVQNYKGLLIARVFLGIAEAGLYPGVVYYISTWYAREDSQFRQALFYCAAIISGSFSGLLAFGISKMDGVSGLAGWRYIFILEGIATVVIAFFAYFSIPNSYKSATFLTPAEKEWVAMKVGSTLQNEDAKFKIHYLKQALTDWQVLTAMFMNMGLLIPIYSVNLFLPTIINELGYTSTEAQLLTIPIYFLATVTSMIIAYVSDKYYQRSPFIITFICVAIVGYIITIVAGVKGVPGLVYAGVFIAVCGLFTAFPGNITWISNNVAGSYKRSVALAIHVGWGNLAGVVSSNIYRAQDSPKFILGHVVAIGGLLLALAAVLTLRIGYKHCNKQRDENAHLQPQLSASEEAELGDKSPNFRYIL
ncbi:Major facilitator superfamily domain, general substrate transporter [Niveomyces insectorum RCEF 264]|uniref:Major facilitator superfamily domain, general substrate transporter n=1 Tax=Niveomyces insectorum RCEF 264 TaxID=1081102 RepID=A0A167RXP3_9HYPO|nr:Major facilitator superfamily domain, general substrate transporter [Niveomyces insectorum RCEF 264]